jgi:hypothetical protein
LIRRVADPRHGLVGTLALLATTLAALFALALSSEEDGTLPDAGQAEEASEGTTLDPERLLELGIDRTPVVARRVEAIRRLEFDRVPEPQISDTARLRRVAERELQKPKVRRALAVAEAELRLLGLLEPDRELDEVAEDVTATALAYYDQRRDELFLVGDAVPTGPELAEFILAHELTHALEDQRFGLPESTGVTDDRALAETALVEGTATELMGQYAARYLNPLALAAEATGLDAGASGELPRFAEAEVEFTYSSGAEFIAELLSLGKGWALVDYAFEVRAPATTEQVLHAEKFLDDERALPVAPPPSPGRGWEVVDTGSLGEFGTREVLAEGEAGLAADTGAAGWGGDRYRLFALERERMQCVGECRSTHALGIVWRGDDRGEARELSNQLQRYLRVGLEGEKEDTGTWRVGSGWAALATRDDQAALGLAPSAREARRIASQP